MNQGNEPKVWIAVASIALLGAGLRAFRLAHQSLWADEVGTYLSSVGTASFVMTQTEINSNVPPLYYLLVNAVLPLGAGEAVLRAPSVIAGVLTIVLVFLVVRHWAGTEIGLSASLLMAISPFHIWYSQEARPYALLLLLAVLSLWCMQKVVERPRNPGWKVGLVIATAAAFYTHTVALGLFALLGLFVLVRVDRREWSRWIPVGLTVAVLIIPAVVRLMMFPPSNPSMADYLIDPAHLVYGVWALVTGYSLGPSVRELQGLHPWREVLRYAPIIVPVLLLTAGLLVRGLLHLKSARPSALYPLGLWLVVPFFFAAVAATFTDHTFNVRYVVIALPALLALLAAGLASFARGPLRIGAWSGVLLVMGLSLTGHYFNPKYHREDTRAAAAVLDAYALSDDLVVVSAPYTVPALRHYLEREDLRLVGYQVWGDGPASASSAVRRRPVTSDEARAVMADLQRIGETEGRYWLFLSRDFHSDPLGYLEGYSDNLFERQFAFASTGVCLALYLTGEPTLRGSEVESTPHASDFPDPPGMTEPLARSEEDACTVDRRLRYAH
jgi:mannosyltransferase